MNYVKIIVKSNYVELRLFIKESKTLQALELIREIHGHTKAGTLDYSPHRGNYRRPENELYVTLRKVRIEKKGISRTLNQLNDESFIRLQSKLKQYAIAA